MPKLARKSAKLFAENATAQAGGIAQFGSLAAGTPNYSKDPDVIQGLSQYSDGWSAAVLGTKSPALEDRNALDYLLSYQQAYIMQHGVPEWISTETYYEHSYVVDSNGELRVSVIDNNIGHDPAQDNGGSYWGYAGARGSGKQIGEVYFSQSSDANDNKGALPLFTGEVISSANTVYPQFYAWVLAHTGLCKTEAEWQTAVTTYGECPFYVIDDTNKTIRLPKLGNYIKMANTDDGVTQSGSSIPAHSHKMAADVYGTTTEFTYLGKAYGGGSNPDYVLRGSETTPTLFNTGSTGTGDEVTPAHTTVFPWVFAFNAAIPASTAQAAQFQAALSGKVDVADLAEIQCVVESGRSGNTWYRLWSDGWCEQGGTITDTTTGTGNVITYFIKEYADTSYTLTLGNYSTYTSDFAPLYISIQEKATTYFKTTYSSGASPKKDWYACGYIS